VKEQNSSKVLSAMPVVAPMHNSDVVCLGGPTRGFVVLLLPLSFSVLCVCEFQLQEFCAGPLPVKESVPVLCIELDAGHSASGRQRFLSKAFCFSFFSLQGPYPPPLRHRVNC